MPGARDVQAAGDRVDALIAELGTLADARARAKAEELVRALIELYGAALERVVEIVTEAGAAEVLRGLTRDDLVSGLLVVHDLHPLTTAERVRAALDEVRPYLGLHEGGVELLDVDPAGVVRLRLEGTCNGCPSSQITVTHAIERAIARAAPEVSEVEVEGVAVEGAAVGGVTGPASPLLQIQPRPPGPCPVPDEQVPDDQVPDEQVPEEVS
ncbi:NifU family protein [Planotetraspora sp. A-T 1434]|uniref:NifU family protein n=1 Tax=Planotetraspora sp. A-T 1434 TaxID=2979219 RepID=UPI0021BDF615|nr:NifU family protein [Planotetraspora sp. A-T 1434]MCT9932213.1 NifU family protein [Planotetraspora sp. A-T 1434]